MSFKAGKMDKNINFLQALLEIADHCTTARDWLETGQQIIVPFSRLAEKWSADHCTTARNWLKTDQQIIVPLLAIGWKLFNNVPPCPPFKGVITSHIR